MFLTKPPEELAFTEDGYDMQWGTNVVGKPQACYMYSLFTPYQLLIPALLAAAESSLDKKARVTFIASIVQGKTINWDSFKDTPARKKTCADQLYAQSKFVCVTTMFYLIQICSSRTAYETRQTPFWHVRLHDDTATRDLYRRLLILVLHLFPCLTWVDAI
jgi:hypothetical protein